MTLTKPGTLLRAEGLTIFLLALWAYASSEGSWLLFVLLVLAPDLSILGYLAGARVGAAAYNLVHTYVGPAVLGMVGLLGNAPLAVHLSLIWAAHIGADRVLGYGLKYPTAFRDTHLQKI